MRASHVEGGRGLGPACPLCRGRPRARIERAGPRRFRRCRRCDLVFLDPEQHPDSAAELARYNLHQNSPADARYRAFLARLVEPLVPRLKTGAEGLDFGSGPGPTLSVMMEESGFRMGIYDPFFAPDAEALDRTYDFITCSETVEHFRAPAREFRLLNRLLRPSGWLGIMTGFLEAAQPLDRWAYASDPTHLCFYSHRTMAWIARRHVWTAEFPAPNVVLLRKESAPTPPPRRARRGERERGRQRRDAARRRAD